MNRHTLRREIQFSGVGLHSGHHATVSLRPAEPGCGLVFVLGTNRVPATAEHMIDTSRATVLGAHGSSVSTVEHLLSALFSVGISDCEIVVDGPEIPVLDGSAKEFLKLVSQAGSVDLGEPCPIIAPTQMHSFADGDRLVIVLPAPFLRIRFLADFPHPIGTQYLDYVPSAIAFSEEIAAARTFGYLHEVEALFARGLALGGSHDNALVFDENGPMRSLQWPNEVVRHKILDLLGDFALVGAQLQAEIIAIKSGHALHVRVARALRENYLKAAGRR